VQNITTTAVVATTGLGEYRVDRNGRRSRLVRVTLTAAVRYRFDEHGTHSSQGTLTDTVLALWTAREQHKLASNDDVMALLIANRKFFYTPATTGTYWVDAAAFSALTGNYTVHVAPDDYAAGTWTAGHVSVGGAATGSIEVALDHDWFSVSLTAGTSYRFDEHGTHSNQGTLTGYSLGSLGTAREQRNSRLTMTSTAAANRESLFIYTPRLPAPITSTPQLLAPHRHLHGACGGAGR